MYISLFDVVGPVMIGPSSSHTAGAAKLARTARAIVHKPFKKVVFGLGGSFAATYKGHFTDYALVAGSLGMREDDENLSKSLSIAKEKGLEFEFVVEELSNNHDNEVRFTYIFEDGKEFFIEGASLGGGRILITSINGLECEVSADVPTIIIKQHDVKGVIRDISSLLTISNINIATMKVNRTGRGDTAFCIIECDQTIPQGALEALRGVDNIISVVHIDVNGGNCNV